MKEKWKKIILITACVVLCLPLLSFLWSIFVLYSTTIKYGGEEVFIPPSFHDSQATQEANY